MGKAEYDKSTFWVGTEIEHTPAYGKKTLFISGVHSVDEINIHITDDIKHLYFGANQSFSPNGTADYFPEWENMIKHFLLTGYLCTLDFDVSCVEDVLECGFTESYNFIPVISVKLPYVQQLGYNATIKLDDKAFMASNPGVWCHQLHKLQNRRVFTDWSQYTNDGIIK